MLRYKRHEETI